MSLRDELDSKQNANDNLHDLPVYHRLHSILTKLICYIDQFDDEMKLSFRSFVPVIFQFDKTFAVIIGMLLMKIARNREDLESMLRLLEENLSENYFERVLIELTKVFSNKYSSCCFIRKLNVNEKLDLAKWFIEEKDQGLFVFDLLKNQVFNQTSVNREQCQNLLRQMRESENFFLRQQALEYTVRWKKKKDQQQRHRIRVQNTAPDPDVSDINFSEIFDLEQN
jgi:hypothetical protein